MVKFQQIRIKVSLATTSSYAAMHMQWKASFFIHPPPQPPTTTNVFWGGLLESASPSICASMCPSVYPSVYKMLVILGHILRQFCCDSFENLYKHSHTVFFFFFGDKILTCQLPLIQELSPLELNHYSYYKSNSSIMNFSLSFAVIFFFLNHTKLGHY